jgi:hypothetical protein
LRERDSDSGGESRRRLTDLRNGLLRLHSALLSSERDLYDRDIERIHSSGRLLELVLNDPAFAWLRELSRLVVTIDEALEGEQPPGASDADRLVARARALIAPGRTGEAFETRYLAALQRDPEVVLAHAETLKLLRELE